MCLPIILLMALAGGPRLQSPLDEGLAALRKNDLRAAQKSFEQAVKLSPRSAQAWLLLGVSYAKQGEAAAGLRAAQKAAEFAGQDSGILHDLALFYLEAGRPDLSIAAARRAIDGADSEEMRTLLGQAYAAKGDWASAIVHFREAVKLSPYNEDAIFHLAQAHLQQQDFAGAVSVLEAGRKTFDKSPQIELSLGVAYYGERRFKDAVDRYLRVMELAPDTPQPYYFLSRILEHALDRMDVVIGRAIHFERRHPQSPLGYLLHAKAIVLRLPATGYPAEAAEAYALLEKADSFGGEQAETHYLLGALLDRKQDYAAAAARFERSIELDPGSAPAHFRLARVYEKLGRKTEAAVQRALHEKLSAEAGAGKLR